MHAAFYECTSLTEVTFTSESGLKILYDYAFYKTSLSSIAIPDSVTQIVTEAFSDCTSLTEVTFTNTSDLLTLNNNAFYNTKLSSIEIPDRVTSIGQRTFMKTSLS